MSSLFSDYLCELGVKHTRTYSDSRFAQMPFRTLFGLKSLLKEYGVDSVAVRVPQDQRESAIKKLPTPYLLHKPSEFLIVTDTSGPLVNYLQQGKACSGSASALLRGWDGVAFLAQADAHSREPHYGHNRLLAIAAACKKVALAALIAGLLILGMIASGLASSVWAWGIAIVNCAGLLLSVLLVQKSLGFKSAAADAVCSIVESGGCDELAKSAASSFFGIVRWSEVGAAYFSVSLLAMLLRPDAMPALAAINILCLPYTVWSVTYQKFKAKVWCTLCLGVQASLWLLFAGYLLGGFTADISLSSPSFYIQALACVCCYGFALLALNAGDDAIIHHLNTRPDDSPSHP